MVTSKSDAVNNNFDLRQALLDAVKAQDVACFRMLLDSACARDVNCSSKTPECPLLRCTKSPGYLVSQEMAILLIRHGVGVDIKDDWGRSPLDWAICYSVSDIMCIRQ